MLYDKQKLKWGLGRWASLFILTLCLVGNPSLFAEEDDGDGNDEATESQIYNRFSPELYSAYQRAQEMCRNNGILEITPMHLFLGLAQEGTENAGGVSDAIFKQLRLETHVNLDAFKKLQAEILPPGEPLPPNAEIKPSDELTSLFKGAERERSARSAHGQARQLTAAHVLLAAMHNPDMRLAKWLAERDINRSKILGASGLQETKADVSQDPDLKSALDEYGFNYTKQVKEGGGFDPVYGRSIEIDNVVAILGQKRQNSPLLIAKAGVGKSALVEELAKLLQDEVDIVEVKLSLLSAGSKYRGDLELRVKKLVKEVKDRNDAAKRGDPGAKPVVIFIDEIHLLLSDSQYSQVAQHIKPAMARGEFPTIGATTPEEEPLVEKDAPFYDRFQRIFIDQPDRELAFFVLNQISPLYEKFHKVKISKSALKAAVDLTRQYIHDQQMPRVGIKAMDNAMAIVARNIKGLAEGKRPAALQALADIVAASEDLLEIAREHADEGISGAAAEVKELEKKLEKQQLQLVQLEEYWRRGFKLWTELQGLQKQEAVLNEETQRQARIKEIRKELKIINAELPYFTDTVGPEEIRRTVAAMANLTSFNQLESDEVRLDKLRGRIEERLVGQPEAAIAIEDAVSTLIEGRARGNKPAEVQLHIGARASGKTFSTQLIEELGLARTGFLMEINLDLYRTDESINNLIGSPEGYIGKNAGQLTEHVRKHPRSVIVFTNIEQGSNGVFDIIRTILTEGKLEDKKTGKRVFFNDTVVILSTSAGSEIALRTDMTPEQKKAAILKLLDEGVARKEKNILGQPSMFKLEPTDKALIDKTVFFDTLNFEQLVELFDREVKALAQNENMKSRYEVELTEAAREHFKKIIKEHGVGSAEGARFVEQLVARNIDDAKTEISRKNRRKAIPVLAVDYDPDTDRLLFGTPESVKEAAEKTPVVEATPETPTPAETKVEPTAEEAPAAPKPAIELSAEEGARQPVYGPPAPPPSSSIEEALRIPQPGEANPLEEAMRVNEGTEPIELKESNPDAATPQPLMVSESKPAKPTRDPCASGYALLAKKFETPSSTKPDPKAEEKKAEAAKAQAATQPTVGTPGAPGGQQGAPLPNIDFSKGFAHAKAEGQKALAGGEVADTSGSIVAGPGHPEYEAITRRLTSGGPVSDLIRKPNP